MTKEAINEPKTLPDSLPDGVELVSPHLLGNKAETIPLAPEVEKEEAAALGGLP